MKIIGPILILLANTFLQDGQQIFSLQQCLILCVTLSFIGLSAHLLIRIDQKIWG